MQQVIQLSKLDKCARNHQKGRYAQYHAPLLKVIGLIVKKTQPPYQQSQIEQSKGLRDASVEPEPSERGRNSVPEIGYD